MTVANAALHASPWTFILAATPVYERMVADTLIVVDANNLLLVFKDGRKAAELGPFPELTGVDVADVVGDHNEDLVLIMKSGISAIDLRAPDMSAVMLYDLSLFFSRYDVVNRPRSLRAFFAKDRDGKAYPVWFDQDGLYAYKDSKKRLIARESPRALLNLMGTQLFMPGEDTVSIGSPRCEALDIDRDGIAEISYLKDGVIKLARTDRLEESALIVRDYVSDYPGVLWDPVGFTFNRASDGSTILAVLSLEFGSSSRSTSANLVATFFKVPDRLQGRTLTPIPLKKQTLDELPLANGVCAFEAAGTDGDKSVVIRTIDIAGAIIDLMTKRSYKFRLQSYVYDPVKIAFEKTPGQIQNSQSIDSTARTEKAPVSATTLLESADLAGMLNSTFIKVSSGQDRRIVVVNVAARALLEYEGTRSRLVRTLRLPLDLRVSDSIFVSKAGAGYVLYSLRGKTLTFTKVEDSR